MNEYRETFGFAHPRTKVSHAATQQVYDAGAGTHRPSLRDAAVDGDQLLAVRARQLPGFFQGLPVLLAVVDLLAMILYHVLRAQARICEFRLVERHRHRSEVLLVALADRQPARVQTLLFVQKFANRQRRAPADGCDGRLWARTTLLHGALRRSHVLIDDVVAPLRLEPGRQAVEALVRVAAQRVAELRHGARQGVRAAPSQLVCVHLRPMLQLHVVGAAADRNAEESE